MPPLHDQRSRSTRPGRILVWAVIVLTYAASGLLTADQPADEPGDFPGLVRDDWILSEAEAIKWHQLKDELGPTLTGNRSWRQFMDFTEEKLREYGVVDIQRNSWTFERWSSSEWPDRSNWSLVSAGKEVEVANYGANSGSTSANGITAELVYYDAENLPDNIAGKIVVFKTKVNQARIERFGKSDYEYRSAGESFPIPGRPIDQDFSNFQSQNIFLQLIQVPEFIEIARRGDAAGAVFVLNAGRELMAGMYTFPVPPIYAVPSLYLDRRVGEKVIQDAKAGARATLRLEATTSTSTAYQLIAYLPGKNYGSPEDEQIQLITHTDGPSISQENGAFGLLAVIRYMAHIPQEQRPRTLMIFLDCRHFMPGQEQAFAAQDWFARNPDARDPIVGVIGMEHLGQIEYVEDGDILRESGRVYPTQIWTSNNNRMVQLAIQAVEDNKLPAAFVRNVARPGIHGENQGRWFGMAKFAPSLGLPAFAVMGFMGAYWATSSGIERFDATLFRRQVATFVQLSAALMTADLSQIKAAEKKLGSGSKSYPLHFMLYACYLQ